jgi:hypothetical protein
MSNNKKNEKGCPNCATLVDRYIQREGRRKRDGDGVSE